MVRLSSAKFGLNSKTHCIKLLGDKLSARSFDSQVNEIHARVAVLNRFTESVLTTYPSYALNLAQLGALCISNLCATKPMHFIKASFIQTIKRLLKSGLL